MGSRLAERWISGKLWLAAALALCLMGSAPVSAQAQEVFTPLASYLAAKGIPKDQVSALLAQPGVHFEAQLLARMLSAKERPRDYTQFFRPEVISRAKAFAQRHAQTLAQSQARTGVSGKVVVAILTIESDLGNYTGKWSAFNVLASQAVLDTPPARRQLAQHWPANQRSTLSTPQFDARLQKRAAWARSELLALMHLSRQWGVSPLAIKSSPAGALGMSQFMPSNIQAYGLDGDGDGKVDLYQPVDAIHSIGNYLRSHGWRPGLPRPAQAKVVYTYNHSQPYVDAVLGLADKI